MRRLWLFGALLCGFAACSDAGGELAEVSAEVAETNCRLVADSLIDIDNGKNFFDDEAQLEAAAVLDQVSADTADTGMADLVAAVATSARGVLLVEREVSFDEYVPDLLEHRRSVAELGLWCLDNTPPEVSAEIAADFAKAS